MVSVASKSVLLVEDELLIRMMIVDMLEELGHHVVGEAGDITRALELARSTDFDLAILDVNINGSLISPVAELIRSRHRPFFFSSGYGPPDLPPEYRDYPTLQKPFRIRKLAETIDKTLKVARSR